MACRVKTCVNKDKDGNCTDYMAPGICAHYHDAPPAQKCSDDLAQLMARFFDTSGAKFGFGRCTFCGDPGNCDKVRHGVCEDCWETLTEIVANEIRNLLLLRAWIAEGHDPKKFVGPSIVDGDDIKWAKKEIKRLKSLPDSTLSKQG